MGSHHKREKGVALPASLVQPPAAGVQGLPGSGAAALLAAIGEAPGLLCLVCGPRHSVVWTNAVFGRLAAHGSPSGVPLATLIPGLDPRLVEALDGALASGEPFLVAECPLALQPGAEERVVDFAGRPFRGAGGHIEGIVLQGTDVTDRVRAAEALKAHRDRADSILDQLGDGFVVLDEEFRVVKLNPAALEYDGREEHEIIGKTHWEAWPTLASPSLEDAYRCCRDEQVQVTVLRRYRGPGKDRWLELRICPVPGGVVSFYKDVTERILAEEALRAGQERFRALVEAVPHQVWEAAATGEAEWFNRRFYEYTGASVDDLDNGSWLGVMHPEDKAATASAWSCAIAHGTVLESEFRLRRAADGAYRWFMSRGVPVHDGEGRVVRWIGTNTDIHDQKTAARALEATNAMLEERVAESTRERDRIWRLSTDLMIVIDAQGRVAAANPAWKALLAWEEGELIGRPFRQLLDPDGAEAVCATCEGAIPLRCENRVRHRDGTFRWISWTVVSDEGYVHAIGRDVTAEREAEKALAQAEEALRQSQKMDAVGQLTGGIAHDFNNLLTGVIGSLDLIRTRIAQNRSGEIGRYVDAAMASAKRAATLTHRLLAFSRRQPLDPKPVDANLLIVFMAELLKRTAREDIDVEERFTEGLWLTHCDANQLENALLNLVINARDAMPAGGRIVIGTANLSAPDAAAAAGHGVTPGDYVVLSVADEGVGMSQDVMEKAFEPFFTTKPIGQGTGLGLSMVYGFVKQSGGHVRIQSQPGRGTTVTIYLPRYLGADMPVPAAARPAPEGRATAGARLLVVEDEPVVRALAVEMLQEMGYVVLSASDGAEGLRILQSGETFDLLLTDVGLPGLNGRQLADAARLVRPDLKVLFMTGYVENALLKEGFLGPGMEVIAKPIAFDALMEKIEAMIRRA
ncbi:hybrid sensor histidine kinase/response regulator [Microvirga thermotolerans]|uniref:hybrid sensor histidine kinase/response regulator n=1 Tax=Microvirga thermotolerans TaxID=2651334 RepID=UPI00188424C3|nr:PAS domain S-box protein [Microvirga thermotolerans]